MTTLLTDTLYPFQFLPFVFSESLLGLVRDLINVRETKDARLAFETLKVLASMSCHKKVVLEWVNNGGIELLLEVSVSS